MKRLIRNADNTKLYEFAQRSDKLLCETFNGDESKVCKGIEAIRESSK